MNITFAKEVISCSIFTHASKIFSIQFSLQKNRTLFPIHEGRNCSLLLETLVNVDNFKFIHGQILKRFSTQQNVKLPIRKTRNFFRKNHMDVSFLQFLETFHIQTLI